MPPKGKDKAVAPEPAVASHLSMMRTLTGIPLGEVFERLDAALPDKAYKPISGGKGERLGLTDIDPAYLPEVFNKVFGPCGIGWAFGTHDYTYESCLVKRKDGKEDTEYRATCTLDFSIAFVGHDGEVRWSDRFSVPGGSTNSQVEWALKGAMTNALGTAAMLLGYQLSVYRGERSHRNPGGNRTAVQDPEPTVKMTLADGIEMLKACDSLLALRKTWFELVGSGDHQTDFWVELSAADQKKLTAAKDAAKESLTPPTPAQE